jgi:hypothetical protein
VNPYSVDAMTVPDTTPPVVFQIDLVLQRLRVAWRAAEGDAEVFRERIAQAGRELAALRQEMIEILR